MTPRSRKPVMLLGVNGACNDINQSSLCKSVSSLNEEDENALLIPFNTSPSLTIRRSKSEGDFSSLSFYNEKYSNVISKSSSTSLVHSESLSSIFKEYLMQRNVITTGPLDSSFASQPEDFESSNCLKYVMEADMTESLLYCMDGNMPELLDVHNSDHDFDDMMLDFNKSRKRMVNISVESDCGTNIGDVECKKLMIDNSLNDEMNF